MASPIQTLPREAEQRAQAAAEPTFLPPGPGAWELDQAHFARPLSAFMQETAPAPFRRGFSESTRRFGLLLDTIEIAPVNGFAYSCARPVGAPPSATKPPPKLVLQILSRLHPEMRRRVATARTAFETKRWREDLARWDDEVKPASNRQHQALQAVDLHGLDTDGLAAHLEACRDQVDRMICQHHRFTITCCLPVGDFLAHAREWTSLPLGDLLAILRGASPVSNGVASEELAGLASAIQADAGARALLDSGRPSAEVLAALRASEGPVAAHAAGYLDVVGYRILGYDIADRCAIDMPDMLVKAIRASADESARSLGERRLAELTASVRARVPGQHQAEFDALLAEARLITRLRDERGFYSDAWAVGLMRRAVLEVGRRASDAGLVDDPELLTDARFAEMISFVRGQPTVTSDELQARADWRSTALPSLAPPWLGAPPAPPPPPEWLPPPAARAARAMDVFLGALFRDGDGASDATVIRGLPVSSGVYEGTARVIAGPEEFGRLQQGDVLVTRATSAYFNAVLPLLGALVTDRGGQLSHAAIVAREYGIPGVVGSRVATTSIPDGARIRVDGSAGEVTLLASSNRR